jgi:eukaryotic-like serine/threonine-protein kinase
MLAMFECLAKAIKDKGLRGMCELVPGGPYIFDVASYAYKLYRDRKQAAALRAALAQIVAASVEEAKRTAEEVVKRVVPNAPIEERISLELYLTQIPGAVRQSLKRAEDPTGKTVPPRVIGFQMLTGKLSEALLETRIIRCGTGRWPVVLL